MSSSARRCGRLSWAGVASMLVVASAACASPTSFEALESLDELPQTPTSTTTAPTTTTISPTRATCEKSRGTATDLAISSLPPDPLPPVGEMPAGTFMRVIARRGVLRVGVDQNTAGLAYRNATTGEIEGFEVDLAHAIAKRIFGDHPRGDIVDTFPVTTIDKTKIVEDGRVDMTVNAISMNCERWEKVAFSAEYYTAVQKFLVRSESNIDSADDLAGRKVCVTSGSTSIGILTEHLPKAKRVLVPARTDCLAELQQGEVDAYFGHDSFLSGMLAQDSNLEVAPEIIRKDDALSHYGIAIHRDHPEFVRFVNAVLEELVADGTWHALHRKWLEALSIEPADPPQPKYRVEP